MYSEDERMYGAVKAANKAAKKAWEKSLGRGDINNVRYINNVINNNGVFGINYDIKNPKNIHTKINNNAIRKGSMLDQYKINYENNYFSKKLGKYLQDIL